MKTLLSFKGPYSITGNVCEAISGQREFLTLKWREQFTGYPAYCTKFKSHAGIWYLRIGIHAPKLKL